MRPTWAEVSIRTLWNNYRAVSELVSPGAIVCAVVKADAYGHGAIACAHALVKENVTWLAVSSVDEGQNLRQGGIGTRILMLSGFWRGDEEEILLNDLTPGIWEPWHLELLEKAARRLDFADGRTVPVHVKFNTGMNRVGMDLDRLPEFLQTLRSCQHVRLEGAFSHFASSEVADEPEVDCQIARFEQALQSLHHAGIRPELVHLANSTGILTRPSAWKDMVRAGLVLYGYHLPLTTVSGQSANCARKLESIPVLSWKTRITSLRSVPANTRIGYGGSYTTEKPAVVATLPVGYGDGLNRALSSRGRVVVRDRYAPIVGRVSMDLTLIDVTGIPDAGLGDEVTIIGASEHCRITAAEHAEIAHTIPYEILCNISKRVPRINVE